MLKWGIKPNLHLGWFLFFFPSQKSMLTHFQGICTEISALNITLSCFKVIKIQKINRVQSFNREMWANKT